MRELESKGRSTVETPHQRPARRHQADVLCICHAFARNYGDRAIFEVLQDAFASQAGLLMRPFPIKPIYVNRHGHSMGPIRKLILGFVLLPGHYLALFRMARSSKSVMLGPGNPLQDVLPLHPVQFLLICLLVRAAGRRYWIFGGGAGPLRTRLGRLCIGLACRLAESVTVRDSVSIQALRSCPGAASKLRSETVPDVVLTLKPDRPHTWQRHPQRIGIAAIHFMRPGRSPGKRDPAAFEAYLGRMERLVRLIVARFGAEVVLFTNEPMEDQETVNDLAARLEDLPQVRVAAVHSVRSALEVAGSCDLHVGGRLHSVIFSVVQGVPAVALMSHGKLAGLYQDLCAQDLLFDIATFDPAEVVDALDRLGGERGRQLLQQVERLGHKAAGGIAAMAAEIAGFLELNLPL